MATTFQVTKNRAITSLNGNIVAGDLTIVVTSSAVFPTTYPFPISIDDEILSVTNNNTGTNTLTVTRAQESTSAASHSSGVAVALYITAKYVTDLNTAVNAIENAKAAASGLASLDGSTLVVQNPANATATPTASKIPVADGNGKLTAGWGGSASTLATLNASTKVVEQPASITDFLDDTAGGTDALTTKAPTSNVMYDHSHDSSPNHAKIADSDAQTSIIVGATADQTDFKNNNVATGTIYSSGIIDLPRQSRVFAYKSAATQVIANSTITKVVLDGESYDTQAEFDPVTNYRFTATKAGYYLIIGAIVYEAVVANKRFTIMFYKNGAVISFGRLHSALIEDMLVLHVDILLLAANDYIELYTQQLAGVNQTVSNGSVNTRLTIQKLS